MLSDKASLKVCLILEQKGKVILLEQTKNNGGRYALIGGKVECEEFATQSLVRESFEEAGIVIQEQNLTLVHALHLHKGKKRQMILYFKTHYWEGEVMSCEPKKFKQATWFDIQNLPEELSKTTRSVLEHYYQGISFTRATVETQIKIVELEAECTA